MRGIILHTLISPPPMQQEPLLPVQNQLFQPIFLSLLQPAPWSGPPSAQGEPFFLVFPLPLLTSFTQTCFKIHLQPFALSIIITYRLRLLYQDSQGTPCHRPFCRFCGISNVSHNKGIHLHCPFLFLSVPSFLFALHKAGFFLHFRSEPIPPAPTLITLCQCAFCISFTALTIIYKYIYFYFSFVSLTGWKLQESEGHTIYFIYRVLLTA